MYRAPDTFFELAMAAERREAQNASAPEHLSLPEGYGRRERRVLDSIMTVAFPAGFDGTDRAALNWIARTASPAPHLGNH